jgi:hypothetical protein
MRELLTHISRAALDKKLFKAIGLDQNDPLIRFFSPKGENVTNYLALDDFAVWAAIARIATGPNACAAQMAKRLLERRLLKAFDINSQFPVNPDESLEETEKRRHSEIIAIEQRIGAELGVSIFKDAEKLDVYGEIGGDDAKKHKKISILLRDGSTREITQLSPTIRTLIGRRTFVRYYGSGESIRRLGLGREA